VCTVAQYLVSLQYTQEERTDCLEVLKRTYGVWHTYGICASPVQVITSRAPSECNSGLFWFSCVPFRRQADGKLPPFVGRIMRLYTNGKTGRMGRSLCGWSSSGTCRWFDTVSIC